MGYLGPDELQVFINLQGLGSSQLDDHLVNEINQGRAMLKQFLILDLQAWKFTLI